MRAINRVGTLFRQVAAVPGSRGLWLLAAVAVAFVMISLTPSADPTMPGFTSVRAAAAPSPYSNPKLATEALDSIKGTAEIGTPAASGPSANIGQTITLKGAGLQPGNASFPGYNGPAVTSPLTNVKAGKKGKAVVPQLAITGPVMAVPTQGDSTNGLVVQIVPTLNKPNPKTVAIGGELIVTGTGFAPDAKVRFTGVAEPVAPVAFNQSSAAIIVPPGTQKGAISLTTSGGTSNTVKIKIVAALANKAMATDPVNGLILVADDNENTLSGLDPQTGHVVRSVAVVDEPTRVLVSADPYRALVLNDEGRFTSVDLDTWTARSPLKGGLPAMALARPTDATLDAIRNVLVAPATSPDRWTLRLGRATEAVVTTPDGMRAIVLAGDDAAIYVVDLSTRTVTRLIRFDAPLEGITIGVDGHGYTMDRATGQLFSFPIE
jgi:hypothetical protein